MREITRKKKVFAKSFAFVVVISLTSVDLQAGGQDGGGGGSVLYCGLDDNSPILQIQSRDGYSTLVKVTSISRLSHDRQFELIDLWEAESGSGPFHPRKLTIPFDQTLSKIDFLKKAFSKLESVDPELAKIIKTYHGHVTRRMEPIPPGYYTLAPEDTEIRYLPLGCRPFGFGVYSDREDNLVYDLEIMKVLSTIDQAAFEVHEAVYKYLRDYKHHRSSWSARHITGFMFAEEPFTKEDLEEDLKEQ